jgi:methylmalonyl-CoA mutase N-terminal domain/subunit
MWAQMMKEMGAKDPRAMMLRFHTQTGGSTLTAQQPRNNVVRVTLQALSAVLGGTQSLHTNGFDEALALPTEEAASLALRTQQIIAHESGVADTVDPLAGSWFVENLTNEIEKLALDYIAKIDAMGGAVAAIEQGYIQDQIARSSYEYQRNLQSGEKVLVGVNRFSVQEEPVSDLFRVDDSIRISQVNKLKKLRSERNDSACREAIAALIQAAKDNQNLMPSILHCTESLCTLGEMADALRSVFGEYRPAN